MAGTVTVQVTDSGNFTSLGTGPMYISVTMNAIIIVASASQPTKGTVGHPVSPEYPGPFFFSLAEVVWATSPNAPPGSSQAVIVTT
jgi:hypothetical protein